MIDPNTTAIVYPSGSPSSDGTAPCSKLEASRDDRSNRPTRRSSANIESSISERLQQDQEALVNDTVDGREDAGPLLALEPTTIENTGQNSVEIEDGAHPHSPDPLLGTIASSGHVHECPEKSPKSKVFDDWRVHPHPVKFVAIDGIRRYF